MSTQEIQDKEVLKEYYSFLYDLAAKKNYLHSSQLTADEKRYCEKLLSQSKYQHKSNELYLPMMKKIMRHHYSEKASHVTK